MAKIDDVLNEIKGLNAKLYGDDGFTGDLPEIKKNIEAIGKNVGEQGNRLTRLETVWEIVKWAGIGAGAGGGGLAGIGKAMGWY